MKLFGAHYPNLEQNASGFYWKPPPAARKAFSTIPFGKEFGPEAMERYYRRQEALARWRLEQKGLAPHRAPAESVEGLFSDYLGSVAVKQLAERTQTEYRRCLTALQNFPLLDGSRFGDKPWAKLMATHADKLYELFSFDEDGEPRKVYARGCMAVARQVWNWAKRAREGELKRNPFEGMRLKMPKPRKVKWTVIEVWTFIQKADELGLLSVAMAALLCYELGIRVSDARKLERSAFEKMPDGRWAVLIEQQKTGREILSAVSDVLSTWLDKLPADQKLLVRNETTGLAYADYELSKAAGKVRTAAGIRDEVRIGDLRRTALTELGRAGGTDDQLVAVSGHATRQMLQVYSRPEYEKTLAVQARRWAMLGRAA